MTIGVSLGEKTQHNRNLPIERRRVSAMTTEVKPNGGGPFEKNPEFSRSDNQNGTTNDTAKKLRKLLTPWLLFTMRKGRIA